MEAEASPSGKGPHSSRATLTRSHVSHAIYFPRVTLTRSHVSHAIHFPRVTPDSFPRVTGHAGVILCGEKSGTVAFYEFVDQDGDACRGSDSAPPGDLALISR